MRKSLGKLLNVIIIIQLFIFSSVLSTTVEQPVISSRISAIDEITLVTEPDYIKANTTLFGILIKVEILNRDDENQTVVELADLYPKAFINASFVNQSLELDQRVSSHDTVMRYSYQPGITVEGDFIMFYINQTGLSLLPDGNYTLWRPINTASKFGYVDPGEALLTILSMNAGIMNITYSNFTNYTPSENHNTDEVSFPFTIPLVLVFIITYTIIFFKRRRPKI